jgi:hypothetical protein
MSSDNPDTARRNELALREAQRRFLDDVAWHLKRQPQFFGTVGLELTIQAGEIGVIRLRCDQTVKT